MLDEDHPGSARLRGEAEPGVETFVAADQVEAGMAEMSRPYNEGGRELYVGVAGSEHD